MLDAIAFDRADLADTIHEGDRVDVVARVMSRSFGGFESLQLEIRDVATAGWHDASTAATADPERAPVIVPVMVDPLDGAPAGIAGASA